MPRSRPVGSLTHACSCRYHTRAPVFAAPGNTSVEREESLHEILVFTLCTLYELQSNAANEKKKAFVPSVIKHGTDDFDLKCLKLGGVG